MTHTSTEQPSIEAIIQDLRESHARATAGTWGKGATTHETVSRTEGRQPYKVADFRHANDAQFCDLAHAHTPRLLDEIEALQKRVQELEAQTAHMADLVELADYATKKLEASQAQRVPLTRKQINECSRDAQIAFCLDKQPTYEVALTREVERRHTITQEKQGC